MRSDVHTAALRAAAKVAFSVAFLGGCSAAAPDAAEDTDPTTGADGVEPGTSESDLSAKAKKKKKPKAAPATTMTNCEDAGHTPKPKPSCEAVVAGAFPTEGDYPGKKQFVSPDVQTCCAELLSKSQGMLENHRWDCCANLGPEASKDSTIAMACTPWGPPVPPSMKRRAKPAFPDAWIRLDEVA